MGRLTAMGRYLRNRGALHFINGLYEAQRKPRAR